MPQEHEARQPAARLRERSRIAKACNNLKCHRDATETPLARRYRR